MIFTSKILFHKILKGYSGITLWPLIIIRDTPEKLGQRRYETLINHERIHLRQQAEMLIIFFYITYLFYYMRNRLKGLSHWKAYLNIPFERESYKNEKDLEYLKKRKTWDWRKY